MQVSRQLFWDYIYPTTIVAADIFEAEGLDKSFKFARSIIELHTALASQASESLEILGTALKTCNEFIVPFQCFKIIKLWFDVKNKSWAGIAALVNITVLTIIGMTKFLAKLKLFDLVALTEKIGAIPVLGTLIQIPMGVFAIGANGFTLIDTKRKLNANTADLQEPLTKLSIWKNRLNDWNRQPLQHPETDQGLQNENFKKRVDGVWRRPDEALTDWQQQKLKLFIESCATVAERTLTQEKPDSPADTANAYLEFKRSKWLNKVSNLKTERTKLRLSVLVNISVISISILGIAATSFGITALAATSMPMLVLGLIVASIAIGKIAYDKAHKAPKEDPRLEELQNDIRAEYKKNKRANGI